MAKESFKLAEGIELDPDVDKNNLDEECARWTSSYDEWSEVEVAAADILERLKVQLDDLKAVVELKIRETKPEDYFVRFGYNLKDLKEATVKALVSDDPGVKQLSEELADARLDLQRIKSAIKTLEGKKSMLTLLTTQFNAGYFSRAEGPDFKASKARAMEQRLRRQVEMERQQRPAEKPVAAPKKTVKRVRI